MTHRFYNPYFFLPVLQGRSNDDQCVEFAEIRKGKHDHIRHDFYHPGYNTGYIVCTLTTKTPTFIGNERTGGIKNRTPGEAKHYEVNGKPAFPANSLNGMIGSLMEALSNSALRVLANERAEELLKNLENGHNLLPWRKGRTHLTPAEQILGVVAEEENGGDGEVHSLAGRIRFSDAEKSDDGDVEILEDRLLKILSSPRVKLGERHNFYFHEESTVSSEEKTVINGRKYYLHQQKSRMELENDEKQWWETKEDENDKINYYKNIHQKTRCRPVATGQEFRFRICFHNLNDAELGLLLAALDPVAARAALDSREEGKTGTGSPSGEFLHRLGFGKPLGLGAVKIKIAQLMMEDVKTSYTSWAPKPVTKEKKDCIDTCLKAAVEAGLIDEKVLEVLLMLGDPGKVDEMVTYPVTIQQYDALNANEAKGERKLFQWFVKNKDPENSYRLVEDDFWSTHQTFPIKLPALNGSSGSGGGGGNRSQKKGGKGNQTGGASGD